MSSDSKALDGRVKQMCRFIEQEAEERASEIRRKTEADCNIEKQNVVHSSKLQLDVEYAERKRELEVQSKV